MAELIKQSVIIFNVPDLGSIEKLGHYDLFCMTEIFYYCQQTFQTCQSAKCLVNIIDSHTLS